MIGYVHITMYPQSSMIFCVLMYSAVFMHQGFIFLYSYIVCTMLWIKLTNRISSYSLLEVDHPEITDTVISQLAGLRSSLKKMTFRGAQILLQKLDALSGEYKLWQGVWTCTVYTGTWIVETSAAAAVYLLLRGIGLNRKQESRNQRWT